MSDVNFANPLAGPYRTGSYLISDVGPDNFRDAMTLPDHPYRASGSHQLGVADFVRVLNQVVVLRKPRKLYLVDLREETHGFFDGAPVSWYADNDFGNVGMGKDLIVAEEEARLKAYEGKSTQLFTIEDDSSDDLQQERVVPISYTDVGPRSVRTEKEVAELLTDVFAPTQVEYMRIPVTDHCAPTESTLRDIRYLESMSSGWDNWVHFHCHGGDGRTTTFLALYDMLCWKRAASRASGESDPFPTLRWFADRQCQLFPYALDPAGGSCGKATTGWKLPLAQARWTVLGDFLNSFRTFA